jgi:hypothetical protein
MTRDDAVIIALIVNKLDDMGVNIKELVTEDKRKKYLDLFEKKYNDLEKDEKLKASLTKILNKYMKKL